MKPPQLMRLLSLMDQTKHIKISTRNNDETYMELGIITTISDDNDIIVDDLPEEL